MEQYGKSRLTTKQNTTLTLRLYCIYSLDKTFLKIIWNRSRKFHWASGALETSRNCPRCCLRNTLPHPVT